MRTAGLGSTFVISNNIHIRYSDRGRFHRFFCNNCSNGKPEAPQQCGNNSAYCGSGHPEHKIQKTQNRRENETRCPYKIFLQVPDKQVIAELSFILAVITQKSQALLRAATSKFFVLGNIFHGAVPTTMFRVSEHKRPG